MLTAEDMGVIATGISALHEEADRRGRDFSTVRIEPLLYGPTRESIERLIELGVTKIHVGAMGPVKPGEAAAHIAPLAEIVAPFR